MTADGGSRVRVAVLDDYQNVAIASADWSVLDADCEIVMFHDHVADPEQLVRRLADFDVVVAMRERTPFPAAVLDRLPRLQLLVTTYMKNAAIDVARARRGGVTVCGTAAVEASAPELAWALLMSLVRHIPAEDAAVRSGGWQHTVGLVLHGRTLGVLGLGRMGQAMTRYARAFDMRVVAWSQNLMPDVAERHGARLVTKDQLFEQSDIVSVHVVSSERTRGIVGRRELALLGPQGYLVNTSRGPVVAEDALVDALRDATIAGAGLDVYDQEPLPAGHPLRSLPRTVLAPHIGYNTREMYEVFFTDAVEDIAGWLRGKPVRELT
jgi:phosphoglycerate dehydrogenase-like enzyme